MPHSLRAKLSGLHYKKIISDKDYQRLCNALDMEKSIDDIKAEIENMGILSSVDIKTGKTIYEGLCRHSDVLEIIDKHIEKEKEQ